jgi:hypothetical protein
MALLRKMGGTHRSNMEYLITLLKYGISCIMKDGKNLRIARFVHRSDV